MCIRDRLWLTKNQTNLPGARSQARPGFDLCTTSDTSPRGTASRQTQPNFTFKSPWIKRDEKSIASLRNLCTFHYNYVPKWTNINPSAVRRKAAYPHFCTLSKVVSSVAKRERPQQQSTRTVHCQLSSAHAVRGFLVCSARCWHTSSKLVAN